MRAVRARMRDAARDEHTACGMHMSVDAYGMRCSLRHAACTRHVSGRAAAFGRCVRACEMRAVRAGMRGRARCVRACEMLAAEKQHSERRMESETAQRKRRREKRLEARGLRDEA